MPAPIRKGRPSDWLASGQAPDNAAQLRRRQIVNETKPCQCPGCDRNCAGISRYCAHHRDLASLRGDPIARLPARNELVIFQKAISLYLDTDPAKAKTVAVHLGALERFQSLPASFCLLPRDIHPKLPQEARAAGLLANWYHRKHKTYTEALTHALALMGWMLVYYDGLPENTQRFLETRCGALLGDFRKDAGSRVLKRPVSGAVHRRLGRRFIRHTREVYGPSFWNSPVTTGDGQDMTILAYTKAALRVAKLL